MMNTILAENLVSFKELEKKIFAYVCELGREITQMLFCTLNDASFFTLNEVIAA